MNLSSLPKHAPHVLIAVGQYNQGKQISVNCPHCNSPIVVESKGNPPVAWVHSCSCGKCNGSIRGL